MDFENTSSRDWDFIKAITEPCEIKMKQSRGKLETVIEGHPLSVMALLDMLAEKVISKAGNGDKSKMHRLRIALNEQLRESIERGDLDDTDNNAEKNRVREL